MDDSGIHYNKEYIVTGTRNGISPVENSDRQSLLPTPRESENTRGNTSLCRQLLLLVVCMYTLFVSFGMPSALGVIYVELINYFEAPRAQGALVQSMYTGMAVGGGLLFSKAITRFGPGRSIVVSTIIGTVAFLAASFAGSIILVILLVGAVAGLSASVNVLGSYVAVSWIFTTNRKTALAVLTTGSTIGQTVLPYLARALIEEYSWQGTLVIFAGVVLNCLPCAMMLYFANIHHDTTDIITHNSREHHNGVEHKRKGCCPDLSIIALVVFVITCAFYNGTGSVELWFIYDMSIMRGLGNDNASLLLSLIGALGLVGRIIAAVLNKCLSTSSAIHLLYAFIVFGVSHFLIAFFHDFVAMMSGAILRGLSSGMVTAMLPGMQLELRGIQRYPVTAGLCNLASGTAQIAGGFMGGTIADVTGSYDMAFYIASVASGVCVLSMCIIMCLLKLNKQPSCDRHEGYGTMTARK